MTRVQRIWIGVSLAALAGPAAAQTAVPTPVVAQTAVPAPASAAVVPDSPIDLFYLARNGAPIWLKDEAGRASVQAFAAILRNGALDGVPDGP